MLLLPNWILIIPILTFLIVIHELGHFLTAKYFGVKVDEFGIGYCNITHCCTEVCPAGIKITDNAIIPLKERIVTEYYDPIAWVAKKIGLRK